MQGKMTVEEDREPEPPGAAKLPSVNTSEAVMSWVLSHAVTVPKDDIWFWIGSRHTSTKNDAITDSQAAGQNESIVETISLKVMKHLCLPA